MDIAAEPSPEPVARLTALATAVPVHTIRQDEVAGLSAELFAPVDGGFGRYAPVYRNAEIDTRHASAPLEWFREAHSFGERNDLFLNVAVDLLVEAAQKALDEAGLTPADIDTLVTVCSSGIATPALDARLMQRMAFRPTTQRLPVFGLGCAGGVLGLSRAAALAKAAPRSRILLLVVELCSLTFRRQDRSKSNIVATALFGDGAAAAVVTCRQDDPGAATGLRLGPWGEHTWPDSLDVMGWDVADDGLKVVFSRDIPSLVRAELRPVVDAFLRENQIEIREIDGFVCHPGGARVLDALEDCFELQRGDLTHARQTLRDHGNMSAVTVLFVLKATIEARTRGRCLMTTLGPGFTAGMMILEAA